MYRLVVAREAGLENKEETIAEIKPITKMSTRINLTSSISTRANKIIMQATQNEKKNKQHYQHNASNDADTDSSSTSLADILHESGNDQQHHCNNSYLFVRVMFLLL